MDFFVRDLFAEGNPVTYLIFLKEKLKIGNNLSSPSLAGEPLHRRWFHWNYWNRIWCHEIGPNLAFLQFDMGNVFKIRYDRWKHAKTSKDPPWNTHFAWWISTKHPIQNSMFFPGPIQMTVIDWVSQALMTFWRTNEEYLDSSPGVVETVPL